MTKKIDCLGDICPIPVMNLKKELNTIKSGNQVMIITDHSCTLKSIKDFCAMHSFYVIYDEVITGVWEITVSNKPFQ